MDLFLLRSQCVWLRLLWMLQLIVYWEILVKLAVICLGLAWLPGVSAKSDFDKFPNVTFKVFSDFVQHQFGKDVSLATVLIVLFSLTSNPDLLGLHARQQHPKAEGEIKQPLSGWIKVLSLALQNRLGEAVDTLLDDSGNSVTNTLATKLDSLSKLLSLDSHLRGAGGERLKLIDENDIAPARILCPISAECETATCNSRAILKFTRDRDIPYVTLVSGSGRNEQAMVVAGQCSKCKTIYHADHEYSVHDKKEMKVYLNSAKYLKVGQKVWVDRSFSKAVLNGMYNFHASTSAFMEFWNMSFTLSSLSRRHVWQAFIQESIRHIAKELETELELPGNLPIDEVTQHAYMILGENGVIRSADGHTCGECTHSYKAMPDVIGGVEDPAGLVGVDENQTIPAFTGERENLDNVDDDSEDKMDVDDHLDSSMKDVKASVHMVILDGIVMGPKHCAFGDCTADLVNYQTGIYCQQHKDLYGERCHMVDCMNSKLDGTLACLQHQRQWNSHVVRFGRSNLLGVQRLLRRSETEGLPWVQVSDRPSHPHDQPAPQQSSQVKHHFVAPRFYCVETICAPCGVVIAWTKFAKAESPSNILDFLESVYPDSTVRPDYVCIDKGCLLLRHAVASGRWNGWKDTTRFIVDSYHYINHRTTDQLCRTYCNPAPLNGSAPNLVEVEIDKRGQSHYKRAFNTQACEQLNAWLGGFETIIKRMSAGNFNWFLHTMLFIHTQRVIEQLKKKTMEKSEVYESDDDN
jgi:hypothetical protein